VETFIARARKKQRLLPFREMQLPNIRHIALHKVTRRAIRSGRLPRDAVFRAMRRASTVSPFISAGAAH